VRKLAELLRIIKNFAIEFSW